ncbi:MAG: recombinase family protein [Alicyclobacillus sp.]|nr:recombinase family protein [Alicyclobacillus sp.]
MSTEEQVQGFSIDEQKERLAAFCASQGWKDYDFYIDDGFTGRNLDRPALKRMLYHIQQGRITAVIVYKLDRLSRRQKDVLHLLEDVFEKHEVAFKSATEPFDTSTPFGKAMIGILAVFAQLERDTIVERTTNGKNQRVRQGLWYGGPVPFGYRWVAEEDRLEIDLAQANIIRQLYQLTLQGMPYRKIGECLYRLSRERLFRHPKTLIYMLQNPIYVGKLNYKGQLIDGSHEAIVDYETWQHAQMEVKRRSESHRPHRRYLLSSLLICGECGAGLKHVEGRKRRKDGSKKCHHYYLCSRKHKSPSACNGRYFPMSLLEQKVINTIKDIALDTNSFRQLLTQQSNENTDDTLLALENKITEIQQRLDRLYDSLERATIDPVRLEARISALEEERAALQRQIDELQILSPETKIEQVISAVQLIAEDWDEMTDEERNEILHLAVDSIVVQNNGDIEVKWA